MYVPTKKRRFFVTVREIKSDNTLGKSESFSVYDSDTDFNRKKLVKFLIDKINIDGVKK